MCRKAILLLGLILVVAAKTNAAFWDVDLIYSGGFTSGDVSLAVDSANVPSASYAVNEYLYVTTKTFEGWDPSQVAPVGFFGGWSSLAVNPSGQLAVSFIDSRDFSNILKYAYKSGGSWIVETVDDVGWIPDYTSLSYNQAGQAVIAYCRTIGTYPETHSYVSYATRIGANNWSKQNIAEVGSVTGPSMTIDKSAGRIYVAYADSASGQLKMAVKQGTNPWQIQVIDGSAGSPAVWYTSIAISDGKPAVAYFISSSDAAYLKYARQQSVWQSQIVTTMSGGSVCYCSLAHTPDGLPLIAYYDTNTQSLKHAWRTDGVWFNQAIDEASQTGQRPSMRLDGLGNISVAYLDNWNGYVKHASAIAPVPLQQVKQSIDGRLVQLSGYTATCAAGDIDHMLYVQSPDRSSGIRLSFSSDVPPVTRGMILDIQGAVTTINEERAVIDPGLVDVGVDDKLAPLYVSNVNLGGSGFHYNDVPPRTGQRGIDEASGLNNIGLLVRTCGWVKFKGTDHFLIDDGSGVMLKCYCPGIPMPGDTSYVAVTGINSCELNGDVLIRMLRVRSVSDVQTIIP